LQCEYGNWKQIAEKVTSDFIVKIHPPDCENIKPVILATLPRSGTTLLGRIISSHNEVCSAEESVIFHGPLLETSQRLFNTEQYWLPLDEMNVAHYLEIYTERVCELLEEQELDKSYITDKSIGNFTSLGAMLSAFPQAKALHCERDPLDISLSCYQHYFPKLIYTSNLEDMARICNVFDCAMEYWKTIFPDRIMTVRYENLVNNSEEVVRNIMNFLGLEWQADCLEFYKNTAVVHTASRQQVRNPINKSGLARWKKYENYLEPVKTTLKKDLDTE